MKLNNIEQKFKEVAGVNPLHDLQIYPLTEHVGFDVRDSEKKANGEVFTPLQLVDKMLEISKPKHNKLNMDLCAGRGQFTIRMIRKFTNEIPDFDLSHYLKKYHWFNEYNIASCLELIDIFGEDINLTCGDARELKNMKDNIHGIWFWEGANWSKITKDELIILSEKLPLKEPEVKPLF
jgi:hypothetical protein